MISITKIKKITSDALSEITPRQRKIVENAVLNAARNGHQCITVELHKSMTEQLKKELKKEGYKVTNTTRSTDLSYDYKICW